MEKKPWAMTQEWHDVVFLHWPVKEVWVRAHLPADLKLDLYDGFAWIGVVLFEAKGTRLRFTPPIPGVQSYLELNVRTYVNYKGRPGVYFFSLDADSILAVKTANTGGFLPYRHARMEMDKQNGKYAFTSRRTHKNSFPESLRLTYEITSGPIQRTYLEHWLTERYCLWTRPANRLIRVDIEHSPWKLQYIKGEIYKNSMASFLPENLHLKRPIAHYGGNQRVLFFPPVPED
ncbi:YqjF family protein [Planococcus shenhongbingii]|uniref:DUF2071 domain-containing protein n=1 Tax=Planococcus shenhongbingii TaxID=3058398 RepID=A0ABT8NAT4_9BACL|nr:DUF2071 domain-containing protein [Planococcus sp. N017]MDN7245004.1 DUF2071 domain-containing protein [Planococcus sp. N017]